ncbi:nucleotidyltransferase domain-containing protein [Heliorestis acidaminivorans]|uniref:Nucleotidyltransferase domain-containing protein n=1 Tax=Heliorestis acidaminivorans TaxID=553427 RepID=A0A6I0F226_9FIRM|nr:nucleotidyltransferase domain-containing protein [Heliorestis acidaminivorans]KAB2953610.1 nucleotidyltransferase domain-containing protein [Heliorestis acidaminivorans]
MARIWHEKEAIRQKVISAFKGKDADLFLFGSRASQNYRANSDYDIGYYTDEKVSSSMLNKLKEE